jgi:hypothetical protein
MEGLPGISSPIKQSSENRDFPIKSAQLSAQVSPTSTKSTPTPLQTPKPLPRWKAGMLQRQISQMNLRRRVRAFSLSDVYSDKREKSTPFSPLVMGNAIKSIDKMNQKTVTIISPETMKEVSMKNELQNFAVTSVRNEQTSPWKDQKDATLSINPFVSGIFNEPSVALNQTRTSSIQDGKSLLKDQSFISVYEPVSERKMIFEQKLINLNNVNKPVQREMQETNVDITEASLKIQKRKNNTQTYMINNLHQSQEAKSSTSNASSLELRREKPSVSIDPYKPPLQVTIEKPAINPFEQYKAMTRSDQKEDANLKEVKIEKPCEK